MLYKSFRTIGLILTLVLSTSGYALEQDGFSTSPTTNNGKRWRVAYYQGGPQNNYYDYLEATVKGLMTLGWLQTTEMPSHMEKNTRSFWKWLSNEIKSDYIEFVNDAYYDSEWNNELRIDTRNRLITRFNEQKDIDLTIAMGTWAGKDLANNEHSVPTMVMSASDPLKAQIIKSIDDSGFDHIHARVDPQRYERQIRLFHNLVNFKKLGVAYENSVYGRTYAAIDLIEKVASEDDFEIVKCYTESDISDRTQAEESVLNCFKELASKVDAIYVTVQGGVNSQTIPKLVEVANRYRISTFSQLGSEEVKYGFFLSISRAGGFKPVGVFLAATMSKIFNGAKPRNLNQLFEEAPNIAINLKTAQQIGIYLYADVLAAADEIYREIETPE